MKKQMFLTAAVIAAVALIAAGAQAAYILEIDTDGADDGVLTYNANFSFGGDTTTASQSAPSAAPGTTGGDSIYGGNGSALPDTYVYTYTPGVDADNYATAMAGGGLGTYAVYATWPTTTNVSGGLTTYTISTPGAADVVIALDQNTQGGDDWVLLGNIAFSDMGSSITVTQEAGTNSFVSMRAYGVMFEAVPEPATLMLLGLGGLLLRRRR